MFEEESGRARGLESRSAESGDEEAEEPQFDFSDMSADEEAAVSLAFEQSDIYQVSRLIEPPWWGRALLNGLGGLYLWGLGFCFFCLNGVIK